MQEYKKKNTPTKVILLFMDAKFKLFYFFFFLELVEHLLDLGSKPDLVDQRLLSHTEIHVRYTSSLKEEFQP